MSIGLSLAAVVIAVVSAVAAVRSWNAAERSARAADRSADAAERSAQASEAAGRRARTPDLRIAFSDPTPGMEDDRVIYWIRNNGPQDLDALVMYRPRPADRITYQLAVTGQEWADDEINLGPLSMTQEARFVLGCGAAPKLPEFWVKIYCRSGTDDWDFPKLLPPPPRPGRPLVTWGN